MCVSQHWQRLHLPVKPHERFDAPTAQQQRQPRAPVQPVRIPHNSVTCNWHAEHEEAVGLDELLHIAHGAQVAVGRDGVAVSAEAVVLEVGYGHHDIELRPLRAWVNVKASRTAHGACGVSCAPLNHSAFVKVDSEGWCQ